VGRWIITGSSGQLGKEMIRLSPENVDWISVGRTRPQGTHEHYDVDFGSPESVYSLIFSLEPDYVIHSGAMTDVDECERSPELAMAINATSAGEIARACKDVGSRMAFISTDYVFDGNKGRYAEEHAPNPIQTYGKTKLMGEELVASNLTESALIIRTSVVFDSESKNFITWLYDSFESGQRVSIVNDQWVTPTYSGFLADSIFSLIDGEEEGMWNVACMDRMSRYEIADSIRGRLGADSSLLVESSVNTMNWVALRPRDSSLDTTKSQSLLVGKTFIEMLDRFEERREHGGTAK